MKMLLVLFCMTFSVCAQDYYAININATIAHSTWVVHIKGNYSVKCWWYEPGNSGQLVKICDTTWVSFPRDSFAWVTYYDTIPVLLYDTIHMETRPTKALPAATGYVYRYYAEITAGRDTLFNLFKDPAVGLHEYKDGAIAGIRYLYRSLDDGWINLCIGYNGTYKVKLYMVTGKVDPYGKFLGIEDTLATDSIIVIVKPLQSKVETRTMIKQEALTRYLGTYDVLGRKVTVQSQGHYFVKGKKIILFR